MRNMNEIKESIKKNGVSSVAGESFEGKNGVTATVLAELSHRQKPQAEITCSVEGCTNTHIREISDWHQSDKCREDAKSKSKGARTGTGLGSVKLPDGTVLREQRIADTDDQETKDLKAALNEQYQAAKAAAQAVKDEEKAQAKTEREAKMAAEKAERDAKKDEERKAALKASLERAKEFSAKTGAPVSQKLIAQVRAAE